MRDMAILLAIVAVLGLPFGLLLAAASQFGVAVVVACVALLLIARMMQAGWHHRDVVHLLREHRMPQPD